MYSDSSHLFQHVISNIFDEPVKRFALKAFFQLELRRDVSHSRVLCGWLPFEKQLTLILESLAPCVEELLVLLVHPHLDDPLVVDRDYRTLRLLRQLTCFRYCEGLIVISLGVTKVVRHESSIHVAHS